jgi:putative resolvase
MYVLNSILGDVNLTEWAHAQGIHVTTAYRWWREGALPVPARKAARLILMSPDTAAGLSMPDAAGLYARVSSHDQRADLDRQVARLSSWAARAGLPVVRVEAGVGSGMNGTRVKARRLLAGPEVTVVVPGHRDRLGRMNTELTGAALAAHDRRLVVVDDNEVTDDLARDMTGVLTSFCARLYGRRPARNRALKAVGCARQDIGPRAAATAGPCGGAG